MTGVLIKRRRQHREGYVTTKAETGVTDQRPLRIAGKYQKLEEARKD